MKTIVFILFSCIGFAEDLYIAQSAAGGGTGANCANALAYTFFNSAANWGAGAGKITAGDMVHICGTITASAGGTLLTFQGSGTAGNVITLAFESGAILQAPYFNSNNGAIEVNGQSYVVIDGGTNGIIQNTANGTSGTYANQQQTKGINLTNASNAEIKNLTIRNLYVRTSTSDNSAYDPTNGACIYTNGFGNGISIHDNTFYDVPWCIDLQYGTGTSVTSVSVYNNTIYNAPHGIVLGGNGSGVITTAYLYNNHIYNFAAWASTTGVFHLTGTHIYGQSTSALTNFWYYNNLTDGTWGSASCPTEPGSCITAHLFVEAGSSSARISNSYIFNNVGITDVGINNGIFGVFQSSVATKVYNNTLISADSTTGVCYYSNNSIAGLDFRNNVMTGCNTDIAIQPTATRVAGSPNYNIYAAGGSNAFICDSNFYNFSQFTNWKACISGDANSSAPASAGINTSTGVPTAGSAVIGAGTNLTSQGISALNTGAPQTFGAGGSCGAGCLARPATGAWDVGAYKFAFVQGSPIRSGKVINPSKGKDPQ